MKVGATRDGLVRGADDGALELLDLPSATSARCWPLATTGENT